MTYKPTRLSAKAFKELRDIVESEIKEEMSDEEIEEMADRHPSVTFPVQWDSGCHGLASGCSAVGSAKGGYIGIHQASFASTHLHKSKRRSIIVTWNPSKPPI